MEATLKLDAVKLGVSAALAVAVIWVVCSILVALFPGGMMWGGGQMMHANMGDFTWNMSWMGVLFGGVIWSVATGILVWLTVVIYQRMI